MLDSIYHMTLKIFRFHILMQKRKGFVICVTLKRHFITFPENL